MNKTLTSIVLGAGLLIGAENTSAFPTIPLNNLNKHSKSSEKVTDVIYGILGIIGAVAYVYVAGRSGRDYEVEEERMRQNDRNKFINN